MDVAGEPAASRRSFSRILLRQVAERLRRPDQVDVDLTGSFDRLEALLAIQLPASAHPFDDRDNWEVPVGHVLRSLFREGEDVDSVVLSRHDDRSPPPEHPSAERIANVVTKATALYANLAGMYGEERLFERVVCTARPNAWLSQSV